MVPPYRPIFDPNDPFITISMANSLIFKTGSLRSERPLFVYKTSPCRQECPIGIDIPGAFDLASKGDMDGALNIFLQENPLPGVCGRVCYHPCEEECNRGKFDESINIRSFERFLSDYGKVDIRKDIPIDSKEYRIAVVGSGPAGLSASYHLTRLGYRVTLFEAKPELGGMLRYGIPPYRLPRPILDREIERIITLGIDVRVRTKIGKNLSLKELESFDAIYISIGLPTGKALFETMKSDDSILTGLDFLANPKKYPLKDERQKILIIGGGNVAIDVARTLLRLRKGKGHGITVICPESREKMPALPEEIHEALEEGIQIINGWAPRKLRKGRGKRSLEFFSADVEINEKTGLVKIVQVDDEMKNLNLDRMIVAAGQTLGEDFLIEGIPFKHGHILTDPFGRTLHPKIFAGGDAIGGKAFVAHAIGSGKMGAFAIDCFIKGKDIEKEFQQYQIGTEQAFSFQQVIRPSDSNMKGLKKVVPFEEINTLFFTLSGRKASKKLLPRIRNKTFDEVSAGLEPEKMEEEIDRCFKCGICIDCENCIDFCPDVSILKDDRLGTYSFDYDHCKGCGICYLACPRNAIEMVLETK